MYDDLIKIGGVDPATLDEAIADMKDPRSQKRPRA